jgi:leucyl-tRNA synthetase
VAEYQRALVENKCRSWWQAQPPNGIDLSAITAAQKFYNLAEFPYPSAEGLHVGHVYTYCGADVLGRYARMTGRQAFQPNQPNGLTTRVDTLYGVTFLGIGPEHPQAYELSGVRALHPITGRILPVYAADYALAEHGTGVVMAVPAHDDRDFLFAKTHSIEIVNVVRPVDNETPREGPFTADGIVINSGEFTGLISDEARRAIASHLSARGLGGSARWYPFHDWLVSRLRYWGTPIPVIYRAECGAVPVPEHQLSVRLPPIDRIRPDGSALSPLARVAEFVNASCPSCGGPATRETDILDTFVESAWYFLRYPSHDLDDVPWSEDRTARLLPGWSTRHGTTCTPAS